MSKVKISELEETTTVQEGCCFPIVTQGVTKKITYGTLANKLNTIIEPEWDKIKNKPSTYAPSAHTHEQSDITGLGTALNGKQDKLTAGSGITIEDNVISATGGGTGGGAVDSVNGKTGTVNLTASDVGALPDTTVIPDKYTLPTASADTLGGVKVGAGLSITNGVLSASGGGVADSVEWDNVQNKPSTYTPSDHTHTTSEITDFPTIPSKTSQLNNDSGFITGYTETDPTVPGHVKEITTTDISNWNNKSDFSGSYNDLTDKPTIPTVPTNISAFNNDSGYLTEHQDLSGKQDSLVSGTNIKTINGNSLLGSGNINISGGISSDVVKNIQVVDELPETEVEGVLYLVKEIIETLVNLYPSQVETTSSNGFTITFKDKNVIVTGSNSSSSVWGETEQFAMDLEANKTYYLQFTHESGTMDDSDRVANSDGIITSIILIGYDSSGNATYLINEDERTASGVYEKYTFTPTQEFASYKLRLQTKKYVICSDWNLSIVVAEESE